MGCVDGLSSEISWCVFVCLFLCVHITKATSYADYAQEEEVLHRTERRLGKLIFHRETSGLQCVCVWPTHIQ